MLWFIRNVYIFKFIYIFLFKHNTYREKVNGIYKTAPYIICYKTFKIYEISNLKFLLTARESLHFI